MTALYPIKGGKPDVHQLESFRPIDFSLLCPNNNKPNNSKVWLEVEREKLKKQIKDLLNAPNAKPEEAFKTMMSQLSKEEQAKIKEMENKGMSKEAIVKQFLSGGLDAFHNDPSQPTDHGQKHAEKQKEREKLKNKLKHLLKDPNKKPEDVFKTMESQLSKEEQAKIKEMQNKGMSKDAIINQFLTRGLIPNFNDHGYQPNHLTSTTHKLKELDNLKDKLKDLLNDPNAKPEDVFKEMTSEFSKEHQAKIQEMLEKGMSKEAIIKLFISGGLDGTLQGRMKYDNLFGGEISGLLRPTGHSAIAMPNLFNSKNVTTMLTAKDSEDRRVVLAKKTIQYFLLPHHINHLIQTGQLSDVQSNVTTSEEREILQATLNYHLLNLKNAQNMQSSLDMDSPQHHHHYYQQHHHHYHHQPQADFPNALPLMQQPEWSSPFLNPQIPSNYAGQEPGELKPRPFACGAADHK